VTELAVDERRNSLDVVAPARRTSIFGMAALLPTMPINGA
jgi:hypothetical protein